MRVVVANETELARVVMSAIERWRVDRPAWIVEPPVLSTWCVGFRLRGPKGDIVLEVEPTGRGVAAHVGRALAVRATEPSADSRAFDELGRAIAALDVTLEIPAADEPVRVESFYNADRTERRFQLVNLGLPRTGTTTLTTMFARWRSAHEFWADRTVAAAMERRSGVANRDPVRALLRERDSAGRLEVDSSSVLHLLCDDVVSTYGAARFVVTWRPFLPWLDSVLSMATAVAARHPASAWPRWELDVLELMLGKLEHEWLASAESLRPRLAMLSERALEYWLAETERTLDTLPRDTLWIQTEMLGSSVPRLARHVGVSPEQLLTRHDNATEQKPGFSDALPTSFRDEAEVRSARHVARCRAKGEQLLPPRD